MTTVAGNSSQRQATATGDSLTTAVPALVSSNFPTGTDRACPGMTKSGKPCRMTPTSDGFCFIHSPNVSPAQRQLAVMKGGYATARVTAIPNAENPSLRTPEDVTAFIELTAGRLMRGEISEKTASVLFYGASVAGRSFGLDITRQIDELRKLAEKYAKRDRFVSVVQHGA